MLQLQADKSGSVFKAILLTIVLLLGLWIIHSFLFVFLVALVGIGIGVIISPVLTLLRKRFRIPRALSALICLLVLFMILGAAGYSLWYLIEDQVETLVNRAPNLIENLQNRFQSLQMQYPWIRAQTKEINVGTAMEKILETFSLGVQFGFASIAGLFLSLLIGLYAAVSMGEYFNDVIRAFPKRCRTRAAEVLSRCAMVLRQWFRAQLLDMFIIGVITALALLIVGAEYWAIFGLLTAIFGIIPYVGIIVVSAGAILITLASDPSMVLWVIGVFVITQQIEGNIVLPLVMKGQVELPEVPLLIFVLFLSVWLGIIGAFLGPALFAMLRVLYLELYIPHVDKLEDDDTSFLPPSLSQEAFSQTLTNLPSQE